MLVLSTSSCSWKSSQWVVRVFLFFRFLFCWDLGSSEVEVEGEGRASQQAWKYTRILPAPSRNTHLLMGKRRLWGAKLALTFHLFHLTFHCSPCSWILAWLALKRIHNSSPLYFALSALFWCAGCRPDGGICSIPWPYGVCNLAVTCFDPLRSPHPFLELLSVELSHRSAVASLSTTENRDVWSWPSFWCFFQDWEVIWEI